MKKEKANTRNIRIEYDNHMTKKKKTVRKKKTTKKVGSVASGGKYPPGSFLFNVSMEKSEVEKLDKTASAMGVSRNYLVSQLVKGFNLGADAAFVENMTDKMASEISKFGVQSDDE